MKIVAVIVLVMACFRAIAYGETNLIGAGQWSPIVTDSEGYGLRGRLLVYHAAARNRGGFTDLARVYLELEHPFVDAWRNPIELLYSAEHDVQLVLQDGTGKSIPAKAYGVRGPPQRPFWISLPCDSSVRLRADMYTLTASTAWHTGLTLISTGEWTISDRTKDYFLSGTFSPATNKPSPLNYHIWSGRIELPRVRIRDEKQ
jgi:hypothetical protein